MKKINKGFTLAELLIVVAIIGVLVGISIPIFNKQIEKAKQVTDLANMRSAYAAAMDKWMFSDDFGKETAYYYDGTKIVTDRKGIIGYGKTARDASQFSDSLPCEASGMPNVNGFGSYIMIRMNSEGVDSLVWGGSYSGQNVTNPQQHNNMSQTDRVKIDKLLIDNIQNQFQDMTYGQIYEMLVNSDGELYPELITGTMHGEYFYVVLSESAIKSGSGEVIQSVTNIFFKDVFENAGFDVSLPADQTYVINSVENNTQRIWVGLGMKKTDFLNLDSSSDKWNQKASKAYTYVKSGGATTPAELKEEFRKVGYIN